MDKYVPVYIYFRSHFCSLLCCVPGRRLKGVAQAKNGEEEHPLTAWGPGESGERSGNNGAVLEPGSAASRPHCKNYSYISSSSLNWYPFQFWVGLSRLNNTVLCAFGSIPGLGRIHPPRPAFLPLPTHCPADHWAGLGQCRLWPQSAGQPRIPAHQPQRAGREAVGVCGALGEGLTR